MHQAAPEGWASEAASQTLEAGPKGREGLVFPRASAPTLGSTGGCGAVRWDQQGPGLISPDLINRPFIFVLKESYLLSS